MSAEWLNVVAAACSALAAFFAWWIALVSLRDSRALAEESRRREAQALEAHLQARLDPLYPGLRAVLGTIDDGVPLEIRSVLIPFFVLYADAFAAHRDGILSDAEWNGLGAEFTNWAQRPVARRAWTAFRKQQWTDGFVSHVDSVLAGPVAYRGMQGVPLTPPTIPWPDQPVATAGATSSTATAAGQAPDAAPAQAERKDPRSTAGAPTRTGEARVDEDLRVAGHEGSGRADATHERADS